MPKEENPFNEEERVRDFMGPDELAEERKKIRPLGNESLFGTVKKTRHLQPRALRILSEQAGHPVSDEPFHEWTEEEIHRTLEEAGLMESSWGRAVGGKREKAILPDGSTYIHRESERTLESPERETRKGKLEFDEWKDKGFDLAEKINSAEGPFIEIAGPTPRGYEALNLQARRIDMKVAQNKLKVSNLVPEQGVDFQADARQMPLRDASAGIVFCSCFGHPEKRVGEESLGQDALYQRNMFEMYKEAARILRPGGLMVVQGRMAEDLDMEKSLGFKIKQYSEFYDELNDPDRRRFDIIMEKIEDSPEAESVKK